MTILQILGGILILTGVWWLLQNVWIFPSQHNHGEARGCGRIKILPSPWVTPFGIDKLLKSLRAERTFRLPLLMVEDHKLYGDTYAQYAGFQFIIITCDPRNTASVLTDQFSKFGFGPTRKISFGPLLGDGIFTADGPAWSASRRLLAGLLKQPKFAPLHTMESHVQDLLRSITARMEKSSQVDLKPILFDYTLDTATGLFLGNSSSLLGQISTPDHQGQRFSTNFNKAIKWIATRERFKNFGWVVVPPSLVHSCRNARDALKNMIVEAEQLEKDGAFGSFLARSTSHDKARDELMNLLFAARDSNASLLSWAMYALARESRAREKLHKEIVAIIGPDPDKQPSMAELNTMTYLDHVISETLRLFPPAPMSGRICDETTTLPVGGGPSGEDPVYVPKGTVICFQIYPCHRSQKHYGEDAMDFRPERWEEVDVKTRTKDYTFHPFIGGPRKCLGELFAMKLAKYTLCRLIQNYDFRTISPEGADWQRGVKYQIGLTSGPEDGVLVDIAARK